MNKKNIILIAISIFLIVALPISALAVSGILNTPSTTNVATSTSTSQYIAISSSITISKVTNSQVTSSQTRTSNITTTSKATSTSTATSKTTTAASTISLSEVQKHNSSGDCYVVISGKVYDLSTFQHPSRDDFTVLCGMDITNSQHPRASAFTSSKVLSYISRYYIGILGN